MQQHSGWRSSCETAWDFSVGWGLAPDDFPLRPVAAAGWGSRGGAESGRKHFDEPLTDN